jgi:glycosyltransferase involved in cell wall biosynthesis
LRIALDATYSVDPRPSGIAVYSLELSDGLTASHAEDQFLHCYRAKQLRRSLLGSGRASAPNVQRRLLLPGFPTFKADLFHALNQRVDRRPAKKVVSTFHDLFVMTGNYSSAAFQQRFTAQARQAVEHSDLIITVSRFTAGQVMSLFNVEPARIRVIPHGVRMPMRTPQAQRERVILFVGALQVRKNVARLVEAFEAVPAHHHWRLVLAGSPTGYGADAILRRIEQSPCRDRIDVTGYVSTAALEELYARASIFAFPSLDEGFGMPVLEAMAHGIPVITSNRSALPEVAGDAALLIDPESREHLVDALLRLTGDPQLRESLANLGRTHATLYPWQLAVDTTYSVYRELLG